METTSHTTAKLGSFYAEFEADLRRIVAHNITAPDGLIEDACQIAWGKLIANPSAPAPGHELGWLIVTASRELLASLRSSDREVSLDQVVESDELGDRLCSVSTLEELSEYRDRLRSLQRLSVREQRLVWLHGLGYGYEEIADQTGDSLRTVERLVLRGRQRLAVAAGQ